MKSSGVMLGLFACFVSLATIAFAQDKPAPGAPAPEVKAAVTGTVSDETGTGVAGATVTMDAGAGSATSATTDGQGLYAITDLAAGSYTISVVLRGTKIFQANVVLSPGQILTMSVAGAPVAQPSPKPPTPSQTAPPPPAAGAEAPAPVGDASTSAPGGQTSGPPPPSMANPAPVPSASAPPAPSPAPSAAVPSTAASEKATVPSEPQIISAPGSFSGPGIGGSVTDQTGAVLVGATVKVSNAGGVVQTAVSDEKGNYALPGLPAGSYNLTVTMKGFKPFEASGLTLTAGESLPLDAALEPAGEQTEVNVSGQNVSQVETETAQVSGTITEKEVLNLGLNGRNFTQLIALTPGVSNQTGQDEAHVGVTGSVKYSVNGGRVEYNTFEVDGGDVLNAGLNGAESTLVVYPSLDAIQEVKVLTSNYGAQYGRTASGTVIVTTKSGGSQYHGDGYEFFRNEALNARNYFDQTTKAPLYRRNDFGFTFGGPVFIPNVYTKKDKTFFFWSEEFRYEKSPTDQQPDFNRAVPSLAERSGDFSDVCPFYTNGFFFRDQWPDCPSTGVNGNNILAETAFFNNQIPLDPNAVVMLNTNLIPLPNSATGCNSPIGSCYDAVISEPTHWREELGRIDHDFNSKVRLSLRLVHDSWNTVVPIPQWQHLPSNTLNSFPTVQNNFKGPGISVVARLTQTISPTFLNDFTASFANSHITLTNANGPGGANYQRPAALGAPGGPCTTVCPLGALFNNGFGGKTPSIVIGGNNEEYGGDGFTVDTSYMPWEHTNPTYSFRDDLSTAIKRHTLQFGVQAIISQKNETNDASGAATGDVQGLLTFSNINGGVNSTGNAFANFLALLGSGDNAIQSYTQDSAQSRYYNRYVIGEPFVQDDWKVNSRLTLNLGVRFSLFGLYHEKYLREYNWDTSAFSPALASQVTVSPTNGQLLDASSQTPIPINLATLDPRILNGLVRCGVNGVPAGCMKGHLFNPAPRVGLAWDPRGDGKTSIRAGYGMFYEHGTGEEANTGSLEASAPYVLNMTQSFPQNYGCIGGSPASGTCFAPPGAYPLNVVAIPTTAVWPYSQQWSLSVQRELPRSMVATIAYVGSKGTHLTVERQLNQLLPLPAALNPFGVHQPLIPEPSSAGAGDCNGFTGHQFQLNNGTAVAPQNPAFINLEAACFGQPPSFAHVGEFPPVPYVNTLRPYPGLGEILALQNVANSDYHGLQATVRRTKGPFTVGGSYSYSHSLDNASDRSDSTFVNSYNLRSNRASSNFDQRHLLNISYIYALPSLSRMLQDWTSGRAGDPIGDAQDPPPPASSSRFLHFLGDGWQLSGITIFQSGTPFSVINGGSSTGISVLDNAGVANGAGAGSYPDLATNPTPPPNERYNTRSFGPLLGNPNMFVAPRGLTFGNAGRNFLNNPHRINFDLNLLKSFKITEGSYAEFRAEAFNVFNHTQFRTYDPNVGNTGSNVISCYGGPNYIAGFAAPLNPATGASTGTDCVTGSGFLHPVDAHRPRTIQLALKYVF